VVFSRDEGSDERGYGSDAIRSKIDKK